MQQLPKMKFDIYDTVIIYRTQLKSKADGGYERTKPTGEIGRVLGYAITADGWEYFIEVAGPHLYHKWVREIGLERGEA